MWSHIPVLSPAGSVALAERHVILTTLLFCAIVVIAVYVLLFLFAWKYRSSDLKNQTEHSPNWDHDSPLAEAAWWFVPGVIILILALLAWRSSHTLDPYVPLESAQGTPITIEVVALNWKWLFIYPAQGIATLNELEVPVGTPVHFELTADAPMNSFWIPALGGQIMVMPGMQTQLNLVAQKAGDFDGSSANISGDGFAGMTFKAHAVSQEDFDAWVASVQQSYSTPLDTSTYAALVAPSKNIAPMTYSSVDLSLFDSSMSKYMTP
jgi:cytochrome o ubiquinol oxidase subunit 2